MPLIKQKVRYFAPSLRFPNHSAMDIEITTEVVERATMKEILAHVRVMIKGTGARRAELKSA